MHPLLRIGRNGAALGAILVLAQCGGNDLTLPSESSPAAISKLTTDNLTGTAGEPLSQPLQVKVLDLRGVPVPNQRVAFTVEGDVTDAEVTSESRTNSDGIAEADWVLGGLAGTQSVRATVVGFTDLFVTFEALVGSAEPQRMEQLDGDGQSAPVETPLEHPLRVRVTDRFGNAVANVRVDWEVNQGSIDPSSTETGPDGSAQASWVMGSVTGTYSAAASSDGLEGSPVGFTAIVTAGSPEDLVLVSGDDQSGDPGEQLDLPLVVRLTDGDGNGVPDRPVSWVVGAGGGSVESLTTSTNDAGEAQVRWTLGPTPGLNTLNAVVSGVGFVSFSARANGGGGGGGGGGGSDATQLRFLVQPSDTEEDANISPAVQVEVLDQNGSRVTEGEFQIKLELTGDDDGKIKGHKDARTSGGVAVFDEIEVDKEGEYRLLATADGLASTESEAFEVHGD